MSDQIPDGWTTDGDAITRTYATDGWPTTLMAVNAIGFLYEAANHHADLAVSWGSVGVTLSTHSEGGVTGKDHALAAKIDEVVLWRPGAPLDGPAGEWVTPG